MGGNAAPREGCSVGWAGAAGADRIDVRAGRDVFQHQYRGLRSRGRTNDVAPQAGVWHASKDLYRQAKRIAYPPSEGFSVVGVAAP